MPSWLGALLGSLLGAGVSIFVASIGWRWQALGKRRAEVAEETLVALATARDAIRDIRSPVGYERPAQGEDDADIHDVAAFRVILRRIDKHAERFAELRKCQLLCRYHFARRAEEGFDAFFSALADVTVAAGGAIRVTLAYRGRDMPAAQEERLQRYEAVFWAGSEDPDQIDERLKTAQDAIEDLLQPHLKADAALIPIGVLRVFRRG